MFAGIGAWSKALIKMNIDHEVVYAVEHDKRAMDSYNIIHNTNFEASDITEIYPSDIPDCDVIFYSPPCQAFSVAGKQEGFEDYRGTLFFDAIKIIREKKPKYAIMENVKGLTGKKFKQEFETMLEELEWQGYKNYWKVLNSKDYGIPQNRERVFIISIREDIEIEYEFPQKFDNGLRLKHLLEDKVDEKYYISEEKTEKLLDGLKDRDKERLLAVKGDLLTRNNPQRQYGFSDTMFTLRGAVQHGVLEVIPFLTPDRLNKRQEGRRFKEIDDASFTVNTQDRHGILQIGLLDTKVGNQFNSENMYDPADLYEFVYRIRKLTPLECLRLMGFNDEDYNKLKENKISNSQIYKMAGNSIVVDTIESLLRSVFKN